VVPSTSGSTLIVSDPKTIRILSAIARAHGHTDCKALMNAKGFQVLWPSIACQTSIGMPHIKEATGHYTIPRDRRRRRHPHGFKPVCIRRGPRSRSRLPYGLAVHL
jgi:hypothetical protein